MQNETNQGHKKVSCLFKQVRKRLGIFINNRLTWQDHVDQMFSSYVLPLFDYADIVWGDRGNSTLMLQLQSLHNKAAKIILDLPIGSSASEALNKQNWKTLARRRAEHRHRRTGRGGRGGLQPPQILGNSDFLGSTRKFGQSQFLKTSPCFYYYFEEINIFYFNLKSA